MANLIGPSFYAGFLDIGVLPDAGRRLLAAARLVGAALRRDRKLFDRGLGFFETTFLTMQRKIFEDQAVMHEAYLDRGLEGIRALTAAGMIDEVTARAWEHIASGDPVRVHDGNRTLLYREQHDIIDRFYVTMRGHTPPEGPAFTYLLTLAGKPAVPGARGYADVFPLTVVAGAIALQTPLAAGNIAVFSCRWKLIEGDTLPAFRRFLADHAAEARALAGTPVARRVRRFRLLRRLGSILAALATRWRVRFEARRPGARRLGLSRTAPAPLPAAGEVTVDLTRPPTRASAGFAPGDDHRAWTGAAHRAFRVTVLLPGSRAYVALATLAALVSPEPGGEPARLTVKLPPTDLAGARRTLEDLAREWSLDAAEVTRWAAAAESATPSDHAYSTRVFRADPIGSVVLEFQVEHHLEDDAFVLDALFSWTSARRSSATSKAAT